MSDVSRSVLLARVADRTLRWRFLSWYWGDAIAADGLLAAETGDGSYRDHVAECLSQWAGTPGSFDDALVPGRAALRLSAAGYLDAAVADRIRSMLDRMAYIAPGVPMLEPHRPVYRFGVCIDAIYHLPVMLAAAGNYYDEPALRQRAIDTALHTLDVLRCDTGWAQWYDAAHDRNNGIAWSRGLGWALLGLLDLVDELDDQGCDAVRERAAQILSSLATAQSGNGHWPVVLYDSTTDNSQTPTETSTAAFFVAAAHHPAAELNAAAVPVLERATEAVLAAVDADGVYQGVSADVLPTWDIADYLRFAVEPSPWGQGAALRALAALVDSAAATSA